MAKRAFIWAGTTLYMWERRLLIRLQRFRLYDKNMSILEQTELRGKKGGGSHDLFKNLGLNIDTTNHRSFF